MDRTDWVLANAAQIVLNGSQARIQGSSAPGQNFGRNSAPGKFRLRPNRLRRDSYNDWVAPSLFKSILRHDSLCDRIDKIRRHSLFKESEGFRSYKRSVWWGTRLMAVEHVEHHVYVIICRDMVTLRRQHIFC